jgi:hypothetical protein
MPVEKADFAEIPEPSTSIGRIVPSARDFPFIFIGPAHGAPHPTGQSTKPIVLEPLGDSCFGAVMSLRRINGDSSLRAFILRVKPNEQDLRRQPAVFR